MKLEFNISYLTDGSFSISLSTQAVSFFLSLCIFQYLLVFKKTDFNTLEAKRNNEVYKFTWNSQ